MVLNMVHPVGEKAHNSCVLQRPGIRTNLPPYLLTVTHRDLANQAAKWNATARWSSWLAGYPAVFQALRDEAHDHGGSIRREFVHSYASRDPVELFYVIMAWGFGTTNVRWPGHQAILSAPPRASIKGIVHHVQTAGAGGMACAVRESQDQRPRLRVRNQDALLRRLPQRVCWPKTSHP